MFVCALQTKLKHADYQPMAKESLKLAVHFLFHTYLHTKKKLRYVPTCSLTAVMNICHTQQCNPLIEYVCPAAWTQRSGWPQWRCC